MTRPSQQELWAETAQLADRFGWSLDAILDLEHHDRRRLLTAEIGGVGTEVPDRTLLGPGHDTPRNR
jgi:hypothetical protein